MKLKKEKVRDYYLRTYVISGFFMVLSYFFFIFNWDLEREAYNGGLILLGLAFLTLVVGFTIIAHRITISYLK